MTDRLSDEGKFQNKIKISQLKSKICYTFYKLFSIFNFIKMPSNKNTRKCSYPSCAYRGEKGLFKIPADRRQKWLEACRFSESQVSKNSVICFKHFDSSAIQSGQKMTLKAWAIPHSYEVSLIMEICLKNLPQKLTKYQFLTVLNSLKIF